MSNALKAIHVGKRELGLDDDDYRGLLARVTGKSSSGQMTEAERRSVLDEMKRLGFKRRSGSARRGFEGGYAKKLRALWISAGHLGLVRNADDAALIAFVKRQTGIDHVRFVRHPQDAAKAIEALKDWMARPAGKGGGGVEWPAKSETSDIARRAAPGFDDGLHCRHRVLDAIEKQLRAAGALAGGYEAYLQSALRLQANHWKWSAAELDEGIALLGAKLRKARGAS